jgi:hypothetical protein
MRRTFPLAFALLFLLVARDASADLTAFVGSALTPANRPARGVAVSVSLLFVGFEFEFSDTGADPSAGAPALRSAMFNLQAQTPRIAGVQAYATAGGGLYQEQLAERKKTNLGTNAGGGVKVPLVGPIGLRLDYRVFTLRGSPLYTHVQRFYVGANLMF